MGCLNPKKLWKRRDGSGTMTAKEELGLHGTLMLSPCGKCYLCRDLDKQDLTIRLYQESLMHGQSSFITLTFSDDFYSPERSFDDVKAFRKLLRDDYGIKQAYIVEEFGEQTHRRHFHMAAFGRDFSGLDESESYKEGLRINRELEMLWGKGQVIVCPITPDTCAYVAGYMQKKSETAEKAKDNEFEPRGRSMSSRGLGRSYCEKYLSDMVANGFCVVGGMKKPIPRVYFDWYPEDLAMWKEERLKMALEQAAPEKRKAVRRGNKNKAINKKAKVALYAREL